MDLGSKTEVVREREGGPSATPILSVAYFAERNTNLGGGESGGRRRIPSP